MAYRGCLTLYCGHCNTGLATLDILMLATVPPSATHMAIKKEKEEEAYKTLRKIPNPDAKKASFSPYKILCKQCNDYVGTVSIVHENTLICFKIENVYFKKGYEEIRGKRLKHIKEKLLRYGLEVVNISKLQLPDAIEQNETPSEPLIYCDVRNGLTTEQVLSFTKQIPRGYQLEMFLEALRGNTLVYLPTGSGKTLIAAMVLSCMKKLNPNKLMVFLVDRIPLVYQQSDYIKSQVPDLRVEILAGDVGRFPGDKSRWITTVQALAENKIDLLVLTHQILLNLMASDPVVVRMSDISVLVFDEAHHCLGNHCYNQVMRDFYRVTSNRCKPLVLALTASPAGADTLQATSKKLEELLSNLSACGRMPTRSTDLEVYWNRPDTEYQVVPLNTKQTVFESNVELYLNSLKELIEWEAKCPRALDKLQVLKHNYRGALRKLIERCYGDKSRVKGLALGEHAMHMLSVIEVNNILGNEYAVECLEECIKQLRMATSPLERLKKKLVGSLNALKVLESSIKDLRRVSSFFAFSDRYQHLTKELENFILRVEKDETSRGIIFVKMRRTAHKLCERLRKETEICEKLNPAFLVGHGRGSDGMDWRGEQEEILKKLRSGEVKLLVSTSVLEEGLDVPVCNLVIRFDSALTVRGIVQSRGRASRRPDSRFVVICSDCKEQTNAFDAIKMENNMERAMRLQQYFTARLQAESFGCEMKKPDLSQRSHLVEPPSMACTEEEPQAEEEDDDVENEYSVEAMTIHERGESLASGGPRKRRKKRVPNVRIAIFNVVTDRNNNKEVSQLTEYFEKYFDVKSLAPETSEVVKDAESSAGEESTSDQSHSVILRLQLEPCEDQIFRKKEKFFTHIVQSWCSRPKAYRSETEKHWLCRDEPSQSQKYSKQVLVIKAEAINLGYFWNRAHFCIHWPFNSTKRMENIRVAFQHDLRTLLICFTMANPFSKWKADLYKLQIRYSELREFVLVDKRSSSSSQEVIISLRHPPRIYRAKNLIKKEQDDEENDFEDWYFDENDYDFDFDDDRGFSSEYSSDSEDDQTTSGVNRSSAESSQVGSEDDTEALLTSSDLARIDDVVNWERVTEIGDSGEAFGLCFAYNFTFKASEWQHVKEVLKSIARYDKKSFFVSMRKSVRRLPEVNISKELPFVVKYAAQCVLSSFPFARGRITTKFATLLGSKPEKTTLSALERLGTALHRNLFCDPEARLEALLNETNLNLGGFPKQLLPDQCAMIKRMVITPTRLLYYTPEIMSKNRVLRNYNTDQFLCVNFRDEDFSRLSSAAGAIDNILERLRRILDSGVIAGGDRFLFLGSSNSQLRNHGCWFVRPSPQPEEIRNWMGDFSRISCVATFMARMGLCFSTSMDAVGIDLSEGTDWEMDNDIKTLDGSYCFSDGVGRISESLARQVAKKIAKTFLPSAIQVRFAGCKGVLTLDPRLPDNIAVFRPSMRKFESSHRRIEVLQTSRPQAVFLNHQLIILLSNLGIPDDVFMRLQRDMLDRLAGMLVNEQLASQQMTSGAKTGIAYTSLSQAGIQLTTEPFFKSLLVALYKERMQNLLSRARILLPPAEARLMIGVMDETGTLKPGEVFAQYSATSNDPDHEGEFSKSKKHILKGPVVITRNPCLHPGDVRQLTAVYAAQLVHLVDCVVFPNHGPRPHPSEMAGGDLDGDLYFVCWNKELLPKRKLFPPMNYEAPPKKIVHGPIQIHHMTEFVAEYIRFDQLGVIDNAHKAHADCDEGGVESSLCLKLAELHSLAVDAPKTGKWPEMPKEAKVLKFPDFMMKSDKPSYPSDKVLGKLYRECRAFKDSIGREVPRKKPHIDSALLVPHFQRYQDEAKELYEEYSNQLQTLMNLYGIETEAELLSGCFLKVHTRLGREKVEIADLVGQILTKIRESFRRRFFREFEVNEDIRGAEDVISEEMRRKASAWYYVAYSNKQSTDAAENGPDGTPSKQFLSFPWLVDDVMLSIRTERAFEEQESPSIVESINESVLKVFEKDRRILLPCFEERLQKKNLIAREIPGMSLALFGSSATLLFRTDSDLDLCVLNSVRVARRKGLDREEQIALLTKLHPIMKKLFKHARLVESAKVPVISCQNPSNYGGPLVKVTGDLSASWEGLLKAIVLSSYIRSYPGLLPVLRLLLSWGHVTGLAGHGVEAGIKSNELTFLLLMFCASKNLVQNFNMESVWERCLQISTGQVSDIVLIQEWRDVLASLPSLESSENEASVPIALGDEEIGEILLTFFQAYNSTLEAEIPQPFASLLGVAKLSELLDAEHLRLLKEHMQRAFHLLALYGDVEVLLTISASEIDRVIFLSEELSYAMAGSERHNAYELSKKTGARVTIRPSLPGSGFGLVLQAIGTESAVASVERALNAMATQALRNRAAIMSVCFVKEAKLMVIEGSLSDDDRITLVPYYGNHHPTHDSLALYVPMLINPRSDLRRIGAAFTRYEFQSFKEKFLTQVQVIERDFVPSIHGEMELAVHFGRIYVLNIPKSFTEDTESPTVSVFQTNLSRGYKPRPSVLSTTPRNDKKYVKTLKSRKVKKRKNNEVGEDGKKAPNRKPSRSSFFTIVTSHEKIMGFLMQRGFLEEKSSESYLVEIHTDHEFCVLTDGAFNFLEIMYPKLRWCAVDVKRSWRENPEDHDITDLDGVETDVRFLLQTRHALRSEDIRGTAYEQYRDTLQPQNSAQASRCPYVVKPEVWKEVALIRHKKSRIYKLSEDLAMQSEFRKALRISVNEVTEYSRPTKHVSDFSKVMTRWEVVTKAGLPNSWSNSEAVEKLLRDIWAFAFALASHLSE